jgi:hypothetical protein
MKYFFWLFLFSFQSTQAQKIKKADKITLSNLQSHISYLADDKLQGRRTGSAGEKLAYEYIIDQFSKTGLAAKGDNETYLQEFEVNDGRAINPSSHLIINNNDLLVNKEFFPLPFCPNKSLEATSALALQESGGPWFYDLKEMLESNKNNPHFDLTEAIKDKAKELQKKGAAALIVFNSGTADEYTCGICYQRNKKQIPER